MLTFFFLPKRKDTWRNKNNCKHSNESYILYLVLTHLLNEQNGLLIWDSDGTRSIQATGRAVIMWRKDLVMLTKLYIIQHK